MLPDQWACLQEPPTVQQGGAAPPAGWPARGTITYENVTASYRAGLPPVLSDLSFEIQVSHHRLCLAEMHSCVLVTSHVIDWLARQLLLVCQVL